MEEDDLAGRGEDDHKNMGDEEQYVEELYVGQEEEPDSKSLEFGAGAGGRIQNRGVWSGGRAEDVLGEVDDVPDVVPDSPRGEDGEEEQEEVEEEQAGGEQAEAGGDRDEVAQDHFGTHDFLGFVVHFKAIFRFSHS